MRIKVGEWDDANQWRVSDLNISYFVARDVRLATVLNFIANFVRHQV